MITEAAYFKNIIREHQYHYCVEAWLEAKEEVDALSKSKQLIHYK